MSIIAWQAKWELLGKVTLSEDNLFDLASAFQQAMGESGEQAQAAPAAKTATAAKTPADAANKVADEDYRNSACPTNYIIDHDGKIVDGWCGNEERHRRAKAALEKLEIK